jgi:hypothetical protein
MGIGGLRFANGGYGNKWRLDKGLCQLWGGHASIRERSPEDGRRRQLVHPENAIEIMVQQQVVVVDAESNS